MKRLILLAMLGAASSAALALDANGERYARQMVNGGPVSIKQAADSMFHTGVTDQDTLDVAAEVLAQNYARAEGRTEADAMAWVCKALGSSGNGRYKALVQQAAGSGIRALEKHCGKAADNLPDGASYVVGSVKLDRFRESGGGGGGNALTAAAAAQSSGAPAGSGSGSFASIKPGMSQQEVLSLIGPPTSMTSHITGKAFVPFNFKGGDTVRQYGLYKGQGRIVYTNDNRYSSVLRVLEVQPNPNESGYP